ncbi:MAG: histidine phosphatase family protein [Bianqueaceae bacterium]
MKLYLARHGQTEWNRLGYYSGQLDEPMNETGRRQIEALARRWQEDVDQIWSSPLSRAVQTAEILRGDRDASVPLLLEPLLLESDFGSWAGKSWTQIAEEDPVGWAAYCWTEGGDPGGRSLTDAGAGKLIGGPVGQYRKQRILLTAHEGILKALLLVLLDLPEDAFWRLALRQGAVTTLEGAGEPVYWVLQGLNG